ncbi:hypothetical protein [Roseospirillum parvum]|uniref:Uncharacterized protein n=1 Tax=Roseospirillum parvum TaxID=83401 RepID=A0A1G7YMZ2_9PROT|nr:hypothetical protein [Roseospirillum parvum]SDG97922.1 hypothetical protein SAMN05421742_103355 [Roseospirillum parvum]
MVCRRIDAAEFNRDYLPICRRIFYKEGIQSVEQCKRPFVNRTWRITALPGPISWPWFPSDDPHWAELAQPDQTSDLDPLIWTWEKLGITQIIATAEGWKPTEGPAPGHFPDPHFRGEATLEDLIDFPKKQPAIALFFDTSGTWGLNWADGEDICLLAGDDCFMDTFYEVSGGEIAVRKRFDHHMLTGGGLFVCHPDHPDKYAYDFLYDDLLKWPQLDWINGTPPEY